MTIVNSTPDSLLVAINDSWTTTIAPGAQRTLVQVFTQPPLPALPWTVVATRSTDGVELAREQFTGGADDQEMVVMPQAPQVGATTPCRPMS